MIVLDTNVVSELLRPEPSEVVVGWYSAQHRAGLRLSAVTVAELLYGVARLPQGQRRNALGATIEDLVGRFSDEVLAFDHAAARAYADIVAGRAESGAPISALDAQIAAICRVNGARLATRNTRDFTGTSVGLIDPWAAN